MIFFAENLRVFKKAYLPVLALMVLSSSIDQLINSNLEQAMLNSSAGQNPVYILGFFALLSGILFPVLTLATALYGLNSLQGWPVSLGHFLARHLNQLYIETLRSWGKTLLWSLFLIIPGIWKFVSYILVPFVVTSSPRYNRGEVDALEASAQIVKHHWLKIFALLLLFQLFIPGLLTSLFDGYRLIWKTPVTSLALSALDAYIFLIFIQILFNIFKREEKKHDAHV